MRCQNNFFPGDDYERTECQEGVMSMMMVDTLNCVGCGKQEFAPSKGKSGRVFNGACEKCAPILFGGSEVGASKTDVPKGK